MCIATGKQIPQDVMVRLMEFLPLSCIDLGASTLEEQDISEDPFYQALFAASLIKIESKGSLTPGQTTKTTCDLLRICPPGICVKTLKKKHMGWVKSIAFSPNASLFASTSADRNIKIWDASTGSLVQTLKGHKDWVYSFAFSPDSSQIASASHDRTIKIWDSATGSILQTLTGHKDWVLSVAFNPDGSKIASTSKDRTMKIWDSSTGRLIKTMLVPTQTSRFSSVFRLDGHKIVATSDNHNIKIKNLTTKVLHTLIGHTSEVNFIVFSPDGKQIASGSNDRTIKLWNSSSGALLQTLTGHTEKILSIAFSPDGTTLTSASGNCTIKIWNLYDTSQLPSNLKQRVLIQSGKLLEATGLKERSLKNLTKEVKAGTKWTENYKISCQSGNVIILIVATAIVGLFWSVFHLFRLDFVHLREPISQDSPPQVNLIH